MGAGSGESQAISMHQPWASLLVYGIKRIEGRSWQTNHHGCLWVHATSQQPSPQAIKEMEDLYRGIWALEDAEPVFPQHYPTSALLGCVDVVDCLRAECVEAWPGIPESVRAEVGSACCFLCESPKRLVVPQKMSGAQKIWTFPGKIARDLAPALRTPPQIGKEPWTWSKFPMPSTLRNADLPRSQNAEKWVRRYGTPTQRHGTPAAQRPRMGRKNPLGSPLQPERIEVLLNAPDGNAEAHAAKSKDILAPGSSLEQKDSWPKLAGDQAKPSAKLPQTRRAHIEFTPRLVSLQNNRQQTQQQPESADLLKPGTATTSAEPAKTSPWKAALLRSE